MANKWAMTAVTIGTFINGLCNFVMIVCILPYGCCLIIAF